jgi:hypothetical protein
MKILREPEMAPAPIILTRGDREGIVNFGRNQPNKRPGERS